MKANKNLKNPTGLRSSLIFFTIALILLFMASCSKEEIDILNQEVGISITFVAPNTIPERLTGKANIRPTYGIMKTEKGDHFFNIISSGDRVFTTDKIKLQQGKYTVSDISLYNAVHEKVMYMEERPKDTTYGSEVVSWVGDEFTFKQGDKYVLKVFYN